MRATPTFVMTALALVAADPLAATERPDQCPGTHLAEDKDHPACPPANTLAWIDCPTRFPPEPSRKFRYGTLYFSQFDTMPDIERHMLDSSPEGGYLYCEYGKTDAETSLYRLIMIVSRGVV